MPRRRQRDGLNVPTPEIRRKPIDHRPDTHLASRHERDPTWACALGGVRAAHAAGASRGCSVRHEHRPSIHAGHPPHATRADLHFAKTRGRAGGQFRRRGASPGGGGEWFGRAACHRHGPSLPASGRPGSRASEDSSTDRVPSREQSVRSRVRVLRAARSSNEATSSRRVASVLAPPSPGPPFHVNHREARGDRARRGTPDTTRDRMSPADLSGGSRSTDHGHHRGGVIVTCRIDILDHRVREAHRDAARSTRPIATDRSVPIGPRW